MAIGYMLAMSLVMGGLFGFINSAQQVFVDVFDAELLFPAIFAMIAMFMALSSMLNARIVGRLGTRRVSHSALFGYIALAIVHSLVALARSEEHTSELQSLMRISYAVFCLKKKKK